MKNNGKINAGASLGTVLLRKSVCGSLSIVELHLYVCGVCVLGGRGSGPQTVLLNDLIPFIVFCSNTRLFGLLVS